LHAIHHASSIQLNVVDGCDTPRPVLPPFDPTNSIDILVWPGLDVAALVIPNDVAPRVVDGVSRLKEFATGVGPERLTPIWVDAKAGAITCPPMETTAVTGLADNPTAASLFRSLTDAHPDLEWINVMGSLANDARLVEYSPPGEAGASGASVTFRGSTQVFAVHLGSGPQTGWGVLVYGLDERKAASCDPADPGASTTASAVTGPSSVTCTRLDRDHPTVEVPGFLPPNFDQVDSQRLAAIDLSRHGLAYFADVDIVTPVDPFGAWSLSPLFGVSRELWSPPFALMTAALALRVAAGPTFGQLRSPVVVPGHFEEDPLKGTARLPFAGALGAFGLEAHLARLSPVSFVVGGGVRAGWVHQRDVPQRPDSLTWGPDVRVGARWRVGPKVAGTVHLLLTYEQIPVAATPNGCTGPSVPRDSVWDVWGGGGLGIEFEP
jgi:hypothetical protein